MALNSENDIDTAQAFASSWNNLPSGSIYTYDQFEDWMSPLTKSEINDKHVLELGCGNASLLVHMDSWNPASITGVDLGDSVVSAQKNTENISNVKIIKGDLVSYLAEKKADLVYCIGVLHHLKDPLTGFKSVVANTKPGGKFHCWVYAKEGNLPVRLVVEPVRFFSSKLPWWFTKYFLATLLVAPYFVYAKVINLLPRWSILKVLPLYEYSLWIAKRNFSFFRHVAFDQLVTPQTTYISKNTIETWLSNDASINKESTYIIMRNGNSWKFGGKKIVNE